MPVERLVRNVDSMAAQECWRLCGRGMNAAWIRVRYAGVDRWEVSFGKVRLSEALATNCYEEGTMV
jgi:hypothetical protein